MVVRVGLGERSERGLQNMVGWEWVGVGGCDAV